MTILSLTLNEPVFVDCERCGGTGDQTSRSYDDCYTCEGHGEVAIDLDWLATLAHNLAIAGFGAAMFLAGRKPVTYRCWEPGLGAPLVEAEAR